MYGNYFMAPTVYLIISIERVVYSNMYINNNMEIESG